MLESISAIHWKNLVSRIYAENELTADMHMLGFALPSCQGSVVIVLLVAEIQTWKNLVSPVTWSNFSGETQHVL